MPTGVYKRKLRTKEHRENLSKSMKGKIPSIKGKTYVEFYGEERAFKISQKLSGILKGRTYEERVGLEKAAKIKKQISRTLTGHKSHRKGLTMEKEYGEKKAGEIKNCIGINTSKAMQNPTVKRKLKIIFLKRKKQNYDIYFPNYNPHACEFFKSYDEQHGTKGQFAMYGGGEYYIDELNYWVDYFNPEIKLIMEYDEPYHYDKNGNLNKKDIQRQNEIQALFPDFKFERIKEELI